MPPLPRFLDAGDEEEARFRTFGFHESYTLAQSIHCQVALSCIFVSADFPTAGSPMMSILGRAATDMLSERAVVRNARRFGVESC